MPDCKPPVDTPDGTLCVLRKNKYQMLGEWTGNSFRGDGPGCLYWEYAPALLAREGWLFAGICPELPDVKPQTAQEIAREALRQPRDHAWPQHIEALQRIAELPE